MPLQQTDAPIYYMQNGAWPISESEIRAAHPNTSFPSPFVAPDEYAPVFPSLRPEYNPVTQRAQEVAPALAVNGSYGQQWGVVELFATQLERGEAISADTEAKRIAAVPASVSPRQIRQALTRSGLRASVEAAVAAGDQDTKDWYEFATEFDINNPIVGALGMTLGVTRRQMEDLWTMGGAL